MTTQDINRFSVQSLTEAIQHLLQNLIKPVMRIFSPTDDDYPDVGVQPYEGDPADKEFK